MLPKRLYEPLPYLYISAALAALTLGESLPLLLFALLLYAAGSAIWVMRSNYRRRNAPRPRHRTSFMVPSVLYEYLPFIYLAAGVLLINWLPTSWGLFSGGMLVLAGILVWMIRAIYRSEPHQHKSA